MKKKCHKKLVGLMLLLIAQWLPVSANDIVLPDLGSSSDSLLTQAQEQALGRDFYLYIQQHERMVDEPWLVQYIRTVGQRVTASIPDNAHQFHFFLLDNPLINAFAGPGGYIGINSGLILASEKESELASVIAHEAAHVTQKHLLRRVENSQQNSFATLGALLAALLISTQSADAGMAAIMTVQAAAMQKSINFTRKNEQEADAIGIGLLATSGYPATAMVDFFSKLNRKTLYSEYVVPEYLRTHPFSQNRVAEANNRLRGLKKHAEPPSRDYFHAKVMLQVLGDPIGSVARLQKRLEHGLYKNQLAMEFGVAFALYKQGQSEKAKIILQKLRGQSPDYPLYTLFLAQVDGDLGETTSTLSQLERLYLSQPLSYPATYYYGEWLSRSGKSGKARKVFQHYLYHFPKETALLPLLAQASNDAGYIGDAYQAQSKYYFLTGSQDLAVEQLESVLKIESLKENEIKRIKDQLEGYKKVIKKKDKQSKNRLIAG